MLHSQCTSLRGGQGHHRWRRLRAEASSDAREARLAANIKTGKVLNVNAREAGEMLQNGWCLLDVRPFSEAQRAPLESAINIPIFIEDPDKGLGGTSKKIAFLLTGGWWLGGTHCILNRSFSESVQQQIPLSSSVVVCCQKGLRSLTACEVMVKAGYQTVAWINGGLDTARSGDIKTTNGSDVRYGGIGGFSELLGWTEVQQEEGKAKLGGSKGVLILFGSILLLDLLVFAIELMSSS